MIAIEIVKGRAHWHWRIKEMGNGEILCASETYDSRHNAERAADGLLAEMGVTGEHKYVRVKVRGYRDGYAYRYVLPDRLPKA